jgi:hypothetical protein
LLLDVSDLVPWNKWRSVSSDKAMVVGARNVEYRSNYPCGRWPDVKIVLDPDDRIPAARIALGAWGWLDRLERYDEGRILTFIRAHLDRCRESRP